MMTDRELLMSFLASLSLCDHMGDVGNEVVRLLKMLGHSQADIDELFGGDGEMDCAWFGRRGIPTLMGQDLGDGS